jgi:hypothetical protein
MVLPLTSFYELKFFIKNKNWLSQRRSKYSGISMQDSLLLQQLSALKRSEKEFRSIAWPLCKKY